MPEKKHTDWLADAKNIQIDGRALINGRRSSALSGETRSSINPANGQKIAEIAYCNSHDADQAVAIARKTFESGVWSQLAPVERKLVLVKWAELIDSHSHEIALLETLDAGKPISDTLNIDVAAAVRQRTDYEMPRPISMGPRIHVFINSRIGPFG